MTYNVDIQDLWNVRVSTHMATEKNHKMCIFGCNELIFLCARTLFLQRGALAYSRTRCD